MNSKFPSEDKKPRSLSRKLFKWGLIASVPISWVLTTNYDDNRNHRYVTARESAEVMKYKKVKSTLINLYKEKSVINVSQNPDFGYGNEQLKPHIEYVFRERDQKLDSLDKAIAIAEQDLTELKQEPNVQTVLNYDGNPHKTSSGALAFTMGLIIYWGSLNYINKLKESQKENSGDKSQ